MILAALFLLTQFIFHQEFPSLPPLEITEADIISVLAEYDVVHESGQLFCQQFYGATNFSTKTIALCARNDSSQQQQTLLHEVVHVLYWRKGIDTGGPYDAAVDAKSKELFQRYFGIQNAKTVEAVKDAIPINAATPTQETVPQN